MKRPIVVCRDIWVIHMIRASYHAPGSLFHKTVYVEQATSSEDARKVAKAIHPGYRIDHVRNELLHRFP